MLTDEVFFSNRWKEMIGYGVDELEGKLSEWQRRVHPDDIESVKSRLQQHFNQEKRVEERTREILEVDLGAKEWRKIPYKNHTQLNYRC